MHGIWITDLQLKFDWKINGYGSIASAKGVQRGKKMVNKKTNKVMV